MFDPISLPLEWAAEKLLIDIPADMIASRLMKEINPQISALQKQLDSVQIGLERDRIADFKAALSFSQLGKAEKAFDELIRAVARNPYSPVAKLLLAGFLLERNKRDEAWKQMNEAAELNPYLLSPFLEATNQNQVQEMHTTWDLTLSNPDFVRQVSKGWPGKFLQRTLGFYPARSTAAVTSASICGMGIAVQWLLGDNLRKRSETIVMALDTRDGSVLWRNREPGYSLLFSAYKHVITFDGNNYSFLDWQTGKTIRGSEMSPEYFSVMYLGGVTLEGFPAFDRSTWKGTPPSDAYEKSAVFQEPRIKSTDPGWGHIPKKWIEGAVLSDPYQLRFPRIKVQNQWEHFHFSGGTGGMFPGCCLDGGGRLATI